MCGREIEVSEVEAVAGALGEVNPAWTSRALRREALVTHLFPRAAAGSAYPEESALARTELERDLALVLGEASDAPAPTIFAGLPRELGFEKWRRARGLEPGGWSGPFEDVGSWFAVRVVAREPGAKPVFVHHELELLERRFLPEGVVAESLLDDCELLVGDPELADLVPLAVRSRMR